VAEVEHRPLEHLGVTQQEGDEQAPDPAVAIKEWVDGFELSMSKSANDERVQAVGVVKEPLKIAQRRSPPSRKGASRSAAATPDRTAGGSATVSAAAAAAGGSGSAPGPWLLSGFPLRSWKVHCAGRS